MTTQSLPESADLRAIRYRFDGPVAIVELHRPHRANAWNGTMHGELLAVMRSLEQRADVRAVVITGTPPTFSVGGDSQALGDHAERGSYDTGLADDTTRPGGDLREEFDEDLSWMFGYRLPIIAAVNGAVAGVSLALVCFCDLRFGSASAKITTAAPKLGLPAEYGLSWILPRMIGIEWTLDLLLSSRPVNGDEAKAIGLVSRVCDTDDVLADAQAYARALATGRSPVAMATIRRQVWSDLSRHYTDANYGWFEAMLRLNRPDNPDFAEGVAAFVEQRPPAFAPLDPSAELPPLPPFAPQ